MPTTEPPAYTVIDKRGLKKDEPPPGHACRICGCPTKEHCTSYKAQPTMECITYLRGQVALYKEASHSNMHEMPHTA